MESGPGQMFLVLMHGDCEVPTRQLARVLGVKHVVPSSVAAAQRCIGYLVGGISSFGTRARAKVRLAPFEGACLRTAHRFTGGKDAVGQSQARLTGLD